MPAEWERHQATWLAWPHNRTDWPEKFDAILWVFADIVRHLARVEDVNLIVGNKNEKKQARKILGDSQGDLKRIRFHVWPTNRIWTRDSGPIFVRRSSGPHPGALINWRFNAWAKYPDCKQDNELPGRIAKKLRLPQFRPMIKRSARPYHVVLEGGSIDVNGAGLMLTTEECLLSKVQQRNPGLSRRDLESLFHDYLGIEKVIWLGRGIAGDDTHGHVDDISRFVSADTVVTAVENNRADANHAPLQENLHRLKSATDIQGRKPPGIFCVVTMPAAAGSCSAWRRVPK